LRGRLNHNCRPLDRAVRALIELMMCGRLNAPRSRTGYSTTRVQRWIAESRVERETGAAIGVPLARGCSTRTGHPRRKFCNEELARCCMIKVAFTRGAADRRPPCRYSARGRLRWIRRSIRHGLGAVSAHRTAMTKCICGQISDGADAALVDRQSPISLRTQRKPQRKFLP